MIAEFKKKDHGRWGLSPRTVGMLSRPESLLLEKGLTHLSELFLREGRSVNFESIKDLSQGKILEQWKKQKPRGALKRSFRYLKHL